ncbi:MAG TPA: GNAT family N-acetyltransferase [Lachnospiraceae bacterium]|nr:GNAT family N-acetyltransferase [Lachnospiraceae bacterium]
MIRKIKTDRLQLRPLFIKDIESVHEYSSDKESTRYMIMLPNRTKEETLQFLTMVTKEWEKSEPSYYEFGIELDKELIGSIRIGMNEERTIGEFGWIINKKYWSRGYATEAALALRDYAQNKLNLLKLEAHCDTRNRASARVMQKIGMTLVFDDGPRFYGKTGENALESKYEMQISKSERDVLLKEALKLYGLEKAKTRFIRHNENMTFQIADQYLLRIHKRIEGFSEATTHEGLDLIEVRRQELIFLEYLRHCGIQVQTPVPNKNGEMVTLFSSGVAATMLTWIEGHTVEEEGCTPELARQIGEMVARMHQAARAYEAEISNKSTKTHESGVMSAKLLSYDEHLCARLKKKLFQVADHCQFSKEDTDSMAGALDVIALELQKTKKDAILLHSDLSLSNMLVTLTGMVPIDFSLFGYCHPMMDLGGLYCCVNGVEIRRAIADGYRQAGEKIDFHALDCCFALAILLGVITHCESWAGQEWFADRMKHWCGETFGPLAEGKVIFSSDFIMLNVL